MPRPDACPPEGGTAELRSFPLSGVVYALLPFILAGSVLLFILYPILSVLKTGFAAENGLTLAVYKNIFANETDLIVNSALTATLSTLLTITVGTAVAVYLCFTRARLRTAMFVVLLLTMISPPFVSSLAYIMLYGKRGMITYGLLGLSWNPYGLQGIVLMQALGHIPLASLIIAGAMGSVDNRLTSASSDLGAGPFATLVRVIIPVSGPGIISAALLSFVSSLSDFGTPMIIGGRFRVLASEAYMAAIGMGDLPTASAMNVLLFIPALAAFALYRRYMGSSRIFPGSFNVPSDDDRFVVRGWIAALVGLITFFFALVMLLQYGGILTAAFSTMSRGEPAFSLKHVEAFFRYNRVDCFVRSLKYAFITATVGTVAGLLLSWFIEKKRIPFAASLDFIVTLPYIIPGSFFGIGYILAFNHEPVYLLGTSAIVVLNCIFRQLPITTKAGAAVLKQIPPEIERAAMDLSAPKAMILKDVILPLLKPAFVVGFINNFTETMVAIGAIIFIISPSAKVATVEMFNAIRDGDYGQSAVFAVFIMAATLAVNLVFSRMILKKSRSRR